MIRYSLTIGTSSTHQWVQAIPGQIILVKQVNIHVYSIEARYMSFMPVVKHFHARVYWSFEGGSFLVMFHVSRCYVVASREGTSLLALVCSVFLRFCRFLALCPWSVRCLVASISDLCRLLYFE